MNWDIASSEGKRVLCWRLLARYASALVVGEAIQKTLALMGRVMAADRVWIARYNDELTHFWNTHEWARPGVTRHVEDLQGVPVEMMLRVHQRMMAGEMILIPDVEKMPRVARSLQAELRRQKIQSSSVFPLFFRGKLLGFYGFDWPVVMPFGWSEEVRRFKRMVAMQLAALVAREALVSGNLSASLEEIPRKVLYVKSSKSRISIEAEQILLLHSYGDYTWIHLMDGKRFMELRSLKSWESLLSRDLFLRVHQRFIVRADLLAGMQKEADGGWSVGLKGWAERIPVGRTYRHLLRSKMGF